MFAVMRKIVLSFFVLFIGLLSVAELSADDEKEPKQTELNFFTGMFDFSDHKQAAGLFGFQHQNDDLFRESFLGNISPITGGFLTENSAAYVYTGAQAEYNLGLITITPSFAPGYYNSGDGKDLGHALEFKTEVQMTLNLSENTEFGMSYNHISNASLGDKNPGANSYMINFLKQF
jgi:lipid A 3-O-deacylase|tara:strand:- start:14 stop:541 length:528 start_codon:yes stop_codon:yes gene_type:complete